MTDKSNPDALVRAAAYLRMSTESQNYSLEHQEAAIAAYALARGFQVVATYTDGGISGLTLRRREGLKRLLRDVLVGSAGFSAILTYDVSRWGRFQDVDESAHYEFLCRQAGVQVAYCAEVFENDGSMVATLLKTMKRAMAAEKSRDLSDTVARSDMRKQGRAAVERVSIVLREMSSKRWCLVHLRHSC
jgi:DNA invertase Pin-like site-specific DNA recombinase